MGRRNKSFVKDLHQQAYEQMQDKLAIGQSRAEDKRNGTAKDKIYAYATYETYWRHIRYFLRWLKKQHPECTTLKKAKRYVPEWLEERVNAGLSAWTIHTELAALCKLYGITADDPNRFQAPSRHREDIKRSRNDVSRDRHFSASNNLELVKFCCGTGVRRNVLQRLRGDDLWTRERIVKELEEKELSSLNTQQQILLRETLEMYPGYDYFIYHRRDKGGKSRYAPIIGPDTAMIVARMRNTAPNERVWQHVHDAADIHGYRADYATALYKQFARPIADIPYDRINRGSGRKYQSEVYTCRKDEGRRKYDRRAMEVTSKALGHNRVCVIAESYLRNI